MFDTHCHLNFKTFQKNLPDVIKRAKNSGVDFILVPGTDIGSSHKAIEIAANYKHIYAAVGIHPHHVYKYLAQEKNGGPPTRKLIQKDLQNLTNLVSHPKCLAIGEVGLDSFQYQNTKYTHYAISEEFLQLQKKLLPPLIKLALEFDKSLIIHNRQAEKDIVAILANCWDEKLAGRVVFHCCEPKKTLLDFAIAHKIYIGIDGDITYIKEKRKFVLEIPISQLVVETDSPYLLPEPLRKQKLFPNNNHYP